MSGVQKPSSTPIRYRAQPARPAQQRTGDSVGRRRKRTGPWKPGTILHAERGGQRGVPAGEGERERTTTGAAASPTTRSNCSPARARVAASRTVQTVPSNCRRMTKTRPSPRRDAGVAGAAQLRWTIPPPTRGSPWGAARTRWPNWSHHSGGRSPQTRRRDTADFGVEFIGSSGEQPARAYREPVWRSHDRPGHR